MNNISPGLFSQLTYPMRWVNRLLSNNDDKLKPIASVGGVKVTSVQARFGDKVVDLVTLTPPTDAFGLSLSSLLHQIY